MQTTETSDLTGGQEQAARALALSGLAATSILVIGSDSRDLVALLNPECFDVLALPTPIGAQLDQRFDVIALETNVLAACEPGDQRALLHLCSQHLLPHGAIVTATRASSTDWTLSEYDALFARCDLHLSERWDNWQRDPFLGGDSAVSVHRRTGRFNVHDMVFAARETILRVSPRQLAARLKTPNPPIVVDTRTPTDRTRFGVIADSIHIPRTLVEWHLDPANGYMHPTVASRDQALVVVCNGGYSSSLSAANLVKLGFSDVSDLTGGMAAWLAAGHPVVPPNHSHLDF